ncbi:HIT-like protein [Hysterangium stoloniferum]|nr:HIT-like protein [Hysterangium stoloniferum]
MPSFLSLIRTCFGTEREKWGHLEDALKLDGVTKPGCIFCDVEPGKGFEIVLQTSNLVVFRDRNPAAAEHLLVTPKRHIGKYKDYWIVAFNTVQEMKTVAHRALDSTGVHFPPEARRLGFHIPPLNSVMHLHLHVHGLPYKSQRRQLKYPIALGSGGISKGWSWFVTMDQAIEILEHGRNIRISPC